MSQGCKCRARANSLQSCQTLCDPMDCSSTVSSVHGTLQARMLEWVAIHSSRGSSWPWTEPASLAPPALAGRLFALVWPINADCVVAACLALSGTARLAASLSIPISPGRDVRLLCLLTCICCHWRFYPGPSGRCEPCHTVVFICISPDDFASFWWFCPPHEQIRSGTDLSLCLFWVMLQYSLEWAHLVQSCPTLCNLMDCSPPGSSVHRIFQARILEWVSISSSKRSPDPGIELMSPALADRFFTCWTTREVPLSGTTGMKWALGTSSCCSKQASARAEPQWMSSLWSHLMLWLKPPSVHLKTPEKWGGAGAVSRSFRDKGGLRLRAGVLAPASWVSTCCLWWSASLPRMWGT